MFEGCRGEAPINTVRGPPIRHTCTKNSFCDPFLDIAISLPVIRSDAAPQRGAWPSQPPSPGTNTRPDRQRRQIRPSSRMRSAMRSTLVAKPTRQQRKRRECGSRGTKCTAVTQRSARRLWVQEFITFFDEKRRDGEHCRVGHDGAQALPEPHDIEHCFADGCL